MSKGNEEVIRGTFVIAAVNSAQGFLSRVVASKTRADALQAIEGAEQWIERVRKAVEDGELPEGFTGLELSPPGPRLPLAPLDGSKREA